MAHQDPVLFTLEQSYRKGYTSRRAFVRTLARPLLSPLSADRPCRPSPRRNVARMRWTLAAPSTWWHPERRLNRPARPV